MNLTDCSKSTSLDFPVSISGGYEVKYGVIHEKSQLFLFLAEISINLKTSLIKLLVCSLSAVLHIILALCLPVICIQILTPSFPVMF